MTLPKSYTLHICFFFMALFLLGSAFYFEYVEYLTPCPLCLSIRLIVLLIGLSSLTTIILRPKHEKTFRILGYILLLWSIFGILLVGRQLYLEHTPSSGNTCLPGVYYLIEFLPWKSVLKSMLLGGPECGHVQWTFLGLSMAGWMGLIFLGVGFISIFEIRRKRDLLEH